MKTTPEKKTPTFKVGDKVISTREGGLPGLRWRAEIYKVKAAPKVPAPDGYAYETLGRWEVVDASKVGKWYKEEKRPTLRQLWSNHLEREADPTINMADFFKLPEVVAAQEIQKCNPYGSVSHKAAHDIVVAVAARYGAESFVGGY